MHTVDLVSSTEEEEDAGASNIYLATCVETKRQLSFNDGDRDGSELMTGHHISNVYLAHESVESQSYVAPRPSQKTGTASENIYVLEEWVESQPYVVPKPSTKCAASMVISY